MPPFIQHRLPCPVHGVPYSRTVSAASGRKGFSWCSTSSNKGTRLHRSTHHTSSRARRGRAYRVCRCGGAAAGDIDLELWTRPRPVLSLWRVGCSCWIGSAGLAFGSCDTKDTIFLVQRGVELNVPPAIWRLATHQSLLKFSESRRIWLIFCTFGDERGVGKPREEDRARHSSGR